MSGDLQVTTVHDDALGTIREVFAAGELLGSAWRGAEGDAWEREGYVVQATDEQVVAFVPNRNV